MVLLVNRCARATGPSNLSRVVTVPNSDPRFSSGARQVSWDVVRAGCVVLVMLYHATFLATCLHPELGERAVRFPFQVGASTLLVVSAFFTCGSVRRVDAVTYWWGRVSRLLPPFLVAVPVIFLVQRVLPVSGWFFPEFGDLGANLLMLWNWEPRVFAFVDPSHWTIPLQIMAFSAAALLYRIGASRRIVPLVWAAVLLPVAQWPLRITNPPQWYSVLVDGVGMHRWHLFAAGVAIWLWARGRLPTSRYLPLLAACMAAQVVHSCTVVRTGVVADWGSDLGVCLGMGLVALAARGPRWEPVVPGAVQRVFRWFAGISYGAFLVHQSIGYLVCHELEVIGAGPAVQTAGMVGTGVVLGWVLTKTVERPAHRVLMRLREGSWHRARDPVPA